MSSVTSLFASYLMALTGAFVVSLVGFGYETAGVIGVAAVVPLLALRYLEVVWEGSYEPLKDAWRSLQRPISRTSGSQLQDEAHTFRTIVVLAAVAIGAMFLVATVTAGDESTTVDRASPVSVDALNPPETESLPSAVQIVQSGDTVWTICESLTLSPTEVPKCVENIRQINDLTETSVLQIGQELELPPLSATTN